MPRRMGKTRALARLRFLKCGRAPRERSLPDRTQDLTMNLPVDLRFIGMLSSESAEAAALHGIHALDALHGEVRGWKVSMEPPQFTCRLSGLRGAGAGGAAGRRAGGDARARRRPGGGGARCVRRMEQLLVRRSAPAGFTAYGC
jgi:hypothetical protein